MSFYYHYLQTSVMNLPILSPDKAQLPCVFMRADVQVLHSGLHWATCSGGSSSEDGQDHHRDNQPDAVQASLHLVSIQDVVLAE